MLYKFSKIEGFSLVETMVSIAVLISLTSIALPSFADLIIKMRVDNEISSLKRLISVARNTAINNSQTVTLCPLDNKNTCINSWHNMLSVFTDTNNNKTFEPESGEYLISVKQAIFEKDKLQYGKSRVGLTYAATGHLSGWGQNATFKYCPFGHSNLSRGIVVSLSGRAYQTSKGNKKQIDKTRSGKIIKCD